jgi:selenium metabolism protein YedF
MKKVIVINSESFGRGSEELGKKLMGAFLKKLWASDSKPGQIVFYNSGVKLLGPDSPVLDALNALFDSGVDLLACGTCITYFELDDKIKVGRVSNMEEIVASFLNSDDVITI